MIVKIIASPANRNFSAVNYNTNKIDRDKGELMKVANFGPLQGFSKLRPQDYINYLQMVTAQNKNIRKPQFHAVISSKNRTYDKSTLTQIAEAWLKEMGYEAQPYLVVFHKDTEHNHVHVVSTRITKEGKKISSAWENVRAQKNMAKVLGYDFALGYQFSTRAQFFMLLESRGYAGKDPNEETIQERLDRHLPDKARAAGIKRMFQHYRGNPEYEKVLKEQHLIELMFHSAEGKKPYGYSIIDHQTMQVFKGSEVMPLKELLDSYERGAVKSNERSHQDELYVEPAYIQSIWIADDVDDQQIHGMRRRRQKKARTNTR